MPRTVARPAPTYAIAWCQNSQVAGEEHAREQRQPDRPRRQPAVAAMLEPRDEAEKRQPEQRPEHRPGRRRDLGPAVEDPARTRCTSAPSSAASRGRAAIAASGTGVGTGPVAVASCRARTGSVRRHSVARPAPSYSAAAHRSRVRAPPSEPLGYSYRPEGPLVPAVDRQRDVPDAERPEALDAPAEQLPAEALALAVRAGHRSSRSRRAVRRRRRGGSGAVAQNPTSSPVATPRATSVSASSIGGSSRPGRDERRRRAGAASRDRRTRR